MRSEECLAAAIATLIHDRFGRRPTPGGGLSDLELDAAEQELGAPFPRSYRVFLRHFGARPPAGLFGLPREGLGGDVVLRNGREADGRPLRRLLFGRDAAGRSFYFDVTRRDADGECPVVARDRAGAEAEGAASFRDFLAAFDRETAETAMRIV